MSAKVAALIALLLIAMASPAQAEVHVSGNAQAVRIEAQDVVLDDVLSALNQKLDLKYRTAVPLQKRINGTYEGPVRQVLSRLLDGYDFFVKDAGGAIEVVVIGSAKAGDSRAVTSRHRRSD